MIELSEGQRKTVATGLTVLSLTLVVAFVAITAWLVLKLLSFAAPAIIPVVLGFFLALFFKPYTSGGSGGSAIRRSRSS